MLVVKPMIPVLRAGDSAAWRRLWKSSALLSASWALAEQGRARQI